MTEYEQALDETEILVNSAIRSEESRNPTLSWTDVKQTIGYQANSLSEYIGETIHESFDGWEPDKIPGVIAFMFDYALFLKNK